MKRLKIVLREIAQGQGYNISTLAEAARLNPATIRKLWHDESKRIDIENLEKVADTLGVSPLELFEVVEES